MSENKTKYFFSRRSYSPGVIISPIEFIKLYEKDKSRIISSEIVPPSIGDSDFGMIRVVLDKTPYGLPITEGAVGETIVNISSDTKESDIQYSIF